MHYKVENTDFIIFYIFIDLYSGAGIRSVSAIPFLHLRFAQSRTQSHRWVALATRVELIRKYGKSTVFSN
jgi:hypothetical protein